MQTYITNLRKRIGIMGLAIGLLNIVAFLGTLKIEPTSFSTVKLILVLVTSAAAVLSLATFITMVAGWQLKWPGVIALSFWVISYSLQILLNNFPQYGRFWLLDIAAFGMLVVWPILIVVECLVIFFQGNQQFEPIKKE